MKTNDANIERFITEFSRNPESRDDIVAGLIRENNRLLLIMPRRGIARRISKKLRAGSFSDFYEFEKTLARALHPVLAGLNLNIISDILVNGLFSEKYPAYARDVKIVMAANRKLSMEILKGVILRMVAVDGHYMVVKFYDLVLRRVDAGLFKTARPAELAVIRMKKGLAEDTNKNTAMVQKIFRGFMRQHGDQTARILVRRMEWDEELRNYLPVPEYMDGPAGDSLHDAADQVKRVGKDRQGEPARQVEPDGSGVKSTLASSRKARIVTYAAVLKQKFLNAAPPDDEEGIRGIVDGAYAKNVTAFGTSEATDIVRTVLERWLDDESLDEGKKRILRMMIEEQRFGKAAEQAPVPEGVGRPQRDSMNGSPGGDHMMGSAPPEEAAHDDMPVSDGELDAIIGEVPDGEPAGDEEEYLIGDEELHELAEQGLSPHDDENEEKFLISGDEEAVDAGHFKIAEKENGGLGHFEIGERDEGELGHFPVEERGVSAESSAGSGSDAYEPADHEFVVQDEILYEDKTLTGKNAGDEKRKKKIRITMNDIADTDTAKRFLRVIVLLATTESDANIITVREESGLSEEFRSVIVKLLDSDGFEEAFEYITKSGGFDYREKIILLQKWLKVIGEKRGWFDRDGTNRLSRINRMIEYYANFVTGRQKEARSAPAMKHGSDTALKETITPLKEGAAAEEDDTEISSEEKIRRKALAVIRTFSDSVETIEPVFERMYTSIPETCRSEIREQFSLLKKGRESLVRKTIEMIRKKTPDRSLLEELNAGTLMQQYIWSEEVKRESGKKNLDEVFKAFETDKDFYRDLTRILKVIKINNKDDLLKNMLAGESGLIREISGGLNRERVKNIWLATAARQSKDKLKLVRDLIELTGDIDPPPGAQHNGAATPAPHDASGAGAKTAGIPRKTMARTGDESIRLSHDIDEFRRWYESGADRADAEKLIGRMQYFFKSLAGGEDASVHFAVYHKPLFVELLRFINDHSELKEMLNISPAVQYCKKKKIL
ncbi:MAG: hypothetical protein A2176_14200 [Spirochaetes bacterium RBG_13_51_14]|nr:MAG: hypothetical protein A2176_14200 [Spirochaetes bacterium RBG_13_51_14]